jgi:hypothetical protein
MTAPCGRREEERERLQMRSLPHRNSDLSEDKEMASLDVRFSVEEVATFVRVGDEGGTFPYGTTGLCFVTPYKLFVRRW